MQIRGIVVLMFVITSLIFPISIGFAAYGRKLCKLSGFQCLHVKGRQSWRSLFPDDHDRGIVMRINRMNTQLYPGLVIAVPANLADADIMDFSPFPINIPSPGEKIVMVDPVEQAWGAYDVDGLLVRWGPASSGADYCKDVDRECRTHSGSFRVYSLGSSDCFSTKFPLPDGGAPMPYCMYFQNGQALHGEPNGLPGYNASHGCVRMYVNDAEWLRYSFIEGPTSGNNYRGTRIIVKDYS
ncbi:MAG: L,D-transpeptidase [Gammaproteobacteria bacterium]|nr:L,D-transpeptidase [Gammaproteobacteria bacterium]MCW5582847.1 L,D-transpeptidase [Gammaproteobacteria bacterium]